MAQLMKYISKKYTSLTTMNSILTTRSIFCLKNFRTGGQTFVSLRKFFTTPFRNSVYDSKQINNFRYFIKVETCKHFWEDVKSPIPLDVEFIDTRSSNSEKPELGVVLALHDLTGSASDLAPIILPLTKLGYRVISPSFPGDGETKFLERKDKYIYTGSTDERATFLHDFLVNIQVDKIDCVIGYGFGCYAALALTVGFSKSLPVKSIAFICPMSYQLSKAHGHLELFRFISMLWDIFFLRPLVFPVITIAKLFYGYPRLTTPQFARAMRALMGCELDQVEGNLVQISWLKIPVSVVFCTQDARVPEADSREFVEVLKLKKTDIFTINKGAFADEKPGPIPRALCIDDASKYALTEYQTDVVLLLLDQLRHCAKM